MKEQYDIFISYTQKDGEIAASLASGLDDLGLYPFLAQKEVHVGEDWEDRVKNALIASPCILAVITPHSKNSAWVNAEAGAAWVLDKPIIAALKDVEMGELFEILRKYQGRHIDTEKERYELIQELASLFLHNKGNQSDPQKKNLTLERFTSIETWAFLLKIGKWDRFEKRYEITGKGIHTYLLSHASYGPRFSISAKIRFVEFHPANTIDSINAGIVIGWVTVKGIRRYYHLLFTGEKLLLELIGGRGGGAYEDFEHIDEGIHFTLREGFLYALSLNVNELTLKILIDGPDGDVEYSIGLPETLNGRVGLRPWRSRMICEEFVVKRE